MNRSYVLRLGLLVVEIKGKTQVAMYFTSGGRAPIRSKMMTQL